jgi:hypothetical protein
MVILNPMNQTPAPRSIYSESYWGLILPAVTAAALIRCSTCTKCGTEPPLTARKLICGPEMIAKLSVKRHFMSQGRRLK